MQSCPYVRRQNDDLEVLPIKPIVATYTAVTAGLTVQVLDGCFFFHLP